MTTLFQSITAQTAQTWLENEEAILIDVRTPEENRQEKIVNAHLCPVDTINVDQLPQTNKKIIIHCQHGIRSEIACTKLLQEDDTLTLYNLIGGISAWMALNLPTHRS